jgi:hypothetical protein
MLRCNIVRQVMFDGIEIVGTHDDGSERQVGGWRVVASAWAVVLVFLILLGGVSAVACQHGGAAPLRPLAGAVIPQHDPCVGPGIPSAQGMDGCKTIPLVQNWANYSNFW